jgi:RecA-family ATPase
MVPGHPLSLKKPRLAQDDCRSSGRWPQHTPFGLSDHRLQHTEGGSKVLRTLAAAGQNHTVKHVIHALTEQSIANRQPQPCEPLNHQIIKAGNHNNLRSASPEQIDGV